MINLKKIFNNHFLKKITPDQAKDTGMAMILICLILGFISKNIFFYNVAIPLLILNMTFPLAYKPIAKVWLLFSHILGAVVSKIIISAVFFIIVTPIGIIRRLFRYDSLQLKKWKKNKSSVFEVRNQTFELKDIEKPF